jgi:CCR4-NOT transcription complex subunit 6
MQKFAVFVISAVILGQTALARKYSQYNRFIRNHQLIIRNLLPTKEYNPDTYKTFSVLQFNTLADYLCDSKSFPHADPRILTWSYRKEKLVQEILQLNADVVQLEEVDHFEMFQEKLKATYEGIFMKKNSEYNKDGCAFFYKKDK